MPRIYCDKYGYSALRVRFSTESEKEPAESGQHTDTGDEARKVFLFDVFMSRQDCSGKVAYGIDLVLFTPEYLVVMNNEEIKRLRFFFNQIDRNFQVESRFAIYLKKQVGNLKKKLVFDSLQDVFFHNG